jgi:hypothetical protein
MKLSASGEKFQAHFVLESVRDPKTWLASKYRSAIDRWIELNSGYSGYLRWLVRL